MIQLIKISEFSPSTLANLSDNDLLPIVRSSGGSFINKVTTSGDYKKYMFSGSVYHTGSIFISEDLEVGGAIISPLVVSSSTVIIDDNILTLNAFSPHERYSGIEVIDSGSLTTSSFLWDSEFDLWSLTNLSASGTITASSINVSTLSLSGISLESVDANLITAGVYYGITSQSTGSYRSSIYEYHVSSGSNIRGGTVFSTFLNGSITYYETTTVDIGDTSQVTFSVVINNDSVELTGSANLTDNWYIKSFVRYF